MRVANRLLKLERTVGLPVLARLPQALEQAAFRIAGTTLAAVPIDAPALDRILDEFIRRAITPLARRGQSFTML